MTNRRWAIRRVLFIWCTWPWLLVTMILLLTLGLVVTRYQGGVSLDLLHISWRARAVIGAVLIGPPLLATIAWGRQPG